MGMSRHACVATCTPGRGESSPCAGPPCEPLTPVPGRWHSPLLGCRNDELSFEALRFGKPFALVAGTPAPVSFNVSHGGQHGLIALAPAGRRIGVDVEERDARRDLDGIMRIVYTPDEQAELCVANGEQKVRLFFNLWTMKEALIKALGTGFSLNPSRFEIPPALRRGSIAGAFRFPHLPRTKWWLESLEPSGFAAAVAFDLAPETAGSGSDADNTPWERDQ